MNRKFLIGAFSLIAIGASASSFAEEAGDPALSRVSAMANVGFGASILVPMLKGEKEFDAVQAELALRMTQSSALAFVGKFPEGASSKGANPAIWANMADFDAKVLDFVKNASAGAAAKPADLDGLKTVYEPLLANCKACHESYRIKN